MSGTTDKLLAEILTSNGFINIDQNDVNRFKDDVKEIDAEKIFGIDDEIGVILNNAIFSIRKRNNGKQMKRLLFVIRIPLKNNFMEHIDDIHEVIDNLEGNVNCQWGISTIDSLQENQFEIIAAVGF